jgi:hypothetical protein
MKHRPLLQRPLDGRDYLLPNERRRHLTAPLIRGLSIVRSVCGLLIHVKTALCEGRKQSTLLNCSHAPLKRALRAEMPRVITLQPQLAVGKAGGLLNEAGDLLAPHERSWRSVWRTFRLREAVSAVLAFVLICALPLLWTECAQGAGEAAREQGASVGAEGGLVGTNDHRGMLEQPIGKGELRKDKTK